MGMSDVLARWLASETGAAEVTIERMALLGGGAIQENWGLDIFCRGGRLDGRHELVLRTDAASRVPVSWNRAQEFRVLEAAHGTGVAAPEPVALCEDPAVIGKVFYLMRRARGEARGHKLVRDPLVLASGDALAARLGAELARLHRLVPPVSGLDFIPVPDRAPALWRVAEYGRHLDHLRAHEPVVTREHLLPRAVADVGRLRRRPDDVGEEQRGEHPVGLHVVTHS